MPSLEALIKHSKAKGKSGVEKEDTEVVTEKVSLVLRAQLSTAADSGYLGNSPWSCTL